MSDSRHRLAARLRGLLRPLVPGAAVAAVCVLLDGSGLLAPLQRPAWDALVRLSALRPPPPAAGLPDVAVVAVDAFSLRARPQWPWPRDLHAETVRRLDAAGARAIAFDLDFSTPGDADEDAALAEAIAASGRVALGAFRQRQRLPGGAELEIASLPHGLLRRAAAAVGSVVMPLDPDAVVRRAERRTRIGGREYPLLGEAALALAMGEAPRPSRSGAFPVDYRRAAPAFPVVSVADLLDGRFDARDLAGRTVFVGATAVEFRDLWATPLGPARPGVLIQALTYRTLAAEHAGAAVLRHPPRAARAAWVLAISLAAAALGGGSHARSLLRLCGLALLAQVGAIAVLTTRGQLVDPVAAPLVIGAHYLFGLETVRRRFGRRLAERERSLVALFRTAEASRRESESQARDGLDLALALLGEVVGARGVALLRAGPDGRLDGRRLDWPEGDPRPAGEVAVAQSVLRERGARVFDGRAPTGRRGSAVYAPLHAGSTPVGVLVVERRDARPFDEGQLRTIATVGVQIALSAENRRLVASLRATFAASVEAVATAIEVRDGHTESHCRRLAVFSALLAERLGLPADEIEAIRLGALLHDVGKIGIRDAVLLKPGRLTPEERAEMRRHAEIGHQIVSPIEGIPRTTLLCVRHHHERWDGSGYPDGLSGAQIPLAARILGIVDVWDALTSARPYKPMLRRERVVELLSKGRGTGFDPALVDLFVRILEEEAEELSPLAPAERTASARSDATDKAKETS